MALTQQKHFILDVDSLVNLWLDQTKSAPLAELFRLAAPKGGCLWVAASSLPKMEAQAKERLIHAGMETHTAIENVRRLMRDLLKKVSVLTNHGFEQSDLFEKATNFEQAQISAAARSLLNQPVCIVTENEAFDTLGEITQKSPAEALSWLLEASPNSSKSVPFINLQTQQVSLRMKLEGNFEKVLRHGQYIMGPEIEALEQQLATFTGAKHCITNSSGTDALLIAMMALGITAGDEIITTPFTFIATGEMIALIGAKPVFVDIDPKTYNIDPKKIEAAITPNTKAIMPVSLYGQCADFDAINSIAKKYSLPVIEDGAQSFGATYKGKRSCALTTIGCTSFFPSKPLGGYGDSGACFTDDDHLAKLMREIRVHGQDRRYHHPIIGINGRMDSLQAAVLLAKLTVFDEEVKARARIGQYYSALIEAKNTEINKQNDAPTSQIVPPYIESFNTSVYAQYTICVQDREALINKLAQAGIPTAVHYPVPLNLQPALSTDEYDLTNSETLSEQVLSLPMHPYLEPEQQKHIIEMLYA